MNINLSTNTKNLSKSQVFHLNTMLLRVCEQKMGKKRVKPQIVAKFIANENMGLYSATQKTIVLYTKECCDIKTYISTFIHEYTHHLQKNLSRKYQTPMSDYEYYRNPHEIEAFSNEKKYLSSVWKEVKPKINQLVKNSNSTRKNYEN